MAGIGTPKSESVLSTTCLSLREAARPIYVTWCRSVPLVIWMNPEKTGKVDASPLGKLNSAMMTFGRPGKRVKLVSLNETEAAAVVSGTGPSAGKMVP